jgi:hypothetical protein
MYQSTMTEQEGIAPPPVSVDKDSGQTITRNPDGTITVTGPGQILEPRIPKKGEFDENLADTDVEVGGLADRLIDFARVDRESREDWEQREKKCLEMLGIKDTIDEKESTAPGINMMTHPMLMEAVVRFQSNAITEIFPATGPAKTKILGTRTGAKQAQADRIEMFVNYYLTEVDREYFADTDQMLLYLPISGSVFRKGGQNWITGMPEMRHVMATNFIAPYAGTDLKSMPRYCHQFTMTGDEVTRAQMLGMFAEVTLSTHSSYGEHPQSADTADARVNVLHTDDTLYTMLEYHVDLCLPNDPLVPKSRKRHVHPYIVVVAVEDQKVLLIRRNWVKGDVKFEKRLWFAHHKLLPGLGFYGFGFCHVIGSLQNAASGAVNAILDAAQMATFQGGFKAKDAKGLAGEVRLEAGKFVDVDCTVEDLRAAFFVPPFKEPGPALPNLLTQLIEAGQRFTGTSDAAVGDASNMGPVGTTIALIEQSQKPQSAIHKRLHKSMSDELRMFGELVHDFMGEKYDYQIGGDAQFLKKEDFNGHVSVISVTDPNISSNTQRIQQAQAVDQAMTSHPDLFPPKKRAAAVLRIFQALKIPDIEEVAPEADTPMYVDAVTENGLIVCGKMVRTYMTQDDVAHLAIHRHGAATAAASPMDPATQQMVMAAYGVHIRDHMAQLYRKQVFAAAGIQPPPEDAEGNPIELPPDVEARVTAAVVAKLPPPPPPPAPPPAAPSPAETAQAKLQAQQTLAQGEVQRQDKMSQMDNERKTRAFLEDEARKDQAHKRALARTKELAAAESKRQDALAAAQVVREGHMAGAKHRMDVKDKVTEHGAKARAGEQSLKQAAAEAKQRLATQREEAKIRLKEKREAAAAKAKAAQEALQQKKQTGNVAITQKKQAGNVAITQKKQAGDLALAQAKAAAKVKPKTP